MAHIHTEPGQHDPTTTAFIIRIDGAEPRALLHMHRKHGRLLPIGGHIELDETPWQAIAHEIPEESGYRLDELRILQPASRIKSLPEVKLHPYPVVLNTHDIPTDHFHSDISYAFVADAAPQGVIADGESADLRWVTRRELEILEGPEIYANTKSIYQFVFDVCLKDWEPVDTAGFEL